VSWHGIAAGRLPPAAPGRRIALQGGSFNPPHRAHLAVARTALARLGVDEVWWLVSPANPLKRAADLAPFDERLAAARALAAAEPRIVVTGFEAARRLTYTIDTARFVHRARPGVRFVFLMGADNLAGLHRWRDWRALARLMPIAIVDRPGASFAAMSAPAAIAFSRHRLPERLAGALADRPPPAWVFLHAPRDPISSTELRRAAKDRARQPD